MRRVLTLVAALALGIGYLPSPGGPVAADSSELFSTPLPIPAEITDDEITLVASAEDVEILPGEPTRMWTFNGTFPGPTIRRPAGERTEVTVVNALPDEVGSITLHNHGNHSAPEHDGQAAGHGYVIEPGAERTYVYELMEDGAPQRGALQWYHDHSHFRTGRNVWMGLAGMFIVEDPLETALGLPSGEYDVPLMIADRRFDADNQLTDAFTAPEREDGGHLHGHGDQYWPPNDEFPGIGNRMLVNGAPEPYFDVEARTYRLRILNASNFRPINVVLSNGQAMTQIGTESGLLPEPVERSAILLGPAERADVLIDFAGASGETIYLESVPDSGNTSLLGTGALARTEPAVQPIMELRVGETTEDTTVVPDALRDLPDWVAEASATPQRAFAFGFGLDEQGSPSWTINGRTFDHDRVDARPEIDSVETWLLANTSVGMSHYIHLHHTDWYLLSRNGRPPPPGEAGMKETFRLDPGEVVVIAAKFSDHVGRYMFHCHMLEHEDHGMMGQFEVVPEGEGDVLPVPDLGALEVPGLPSPPDLSDLVPDELPGPGGLSDLTGGAQIVAPPSGVGGGAYLPATAYHAEGEVAELTNLDNNTHDVTADDYLAPGVPLFQSDLANIGQTVPILRTDQLAPGRYGYHCSLHGSMTGELVVE